MMTSNVAEFESLPPMPAASAHAHAPTSTHPLPVPVPYPAGVQVKHEPQDGQNPYAGLPPPGMLPYVLPAIPFCDSIDSLGVG